MRIVLTCDFFLKYAIAQSAGLANAGADVLLLCRTHAREFGGSTAERARAMDGARRHGVQVVEIPGRLWDAGVARALAAVRARVHRFRPDVVHAHDGADLRALALVPRVPTVLTLHDPVPHPGHPVPPLYKRWYLHGGRDAWRRRATVIIVHSDQLRAEVRPMRPGQRVEAVPHGLHAQDAPLTAPAEATVGLFGRLTAYKGLDVLARAMPIVWEHRPDAHLLVAGDGEASLDLSDQRVEFDRRYLPESKVDSFLARTSLMVLPYTQASQTGVGSIAVGHGIPLVVSRVGALADLALDESYVVPAGDERALARAIVAHIDDGIDVRRRVLAEIAAPLTWEAVSRRLLVLYRELARRE